MYICPECAHEWNPAEATEESDILMVKDANGNLLADGDSVTVVKDLKVKGSSSDAENRHQSENIRLVEGDRNIDCKIDCLGPMKLKSEFVKRTDLISGRRRDYFSHNRRRSDTSWWPFVPGASCYFLAGNRYLRCRLPSYFSALFRPAVWLANHRRATITLYGLRSLRYSPCP